MKFRNGFIRKWRGVKDPVSRDPNSAVSRGPETGGAVARRCRGGGTPGAHTHKVSVKVISGPQVYGMTLRQCVKCLTMVLKLIFRKFLSKLENCEKIFCHQTFNSIHVFSKIGKFGN